VKTKTMDSRLIACHCTIYSDDDVGSEASDDIAGWRICLDRSDAEHPTLPIVFASKRDAERVIAELIKHGVVDEDSYDKLRDGGRLIDMCIADSLPW
jgi:hypothetical protein